MNWSPQQTLLFQPSFIFASETTYRVALNTSIWPGWKGLRCTNTQSPQVTKDFFLHWLQHNICKNFNIHGVPTIRIFYPGLVSGMGESVPHSMDVSFNRREILKAIEIAQSHQVQMF